MADVKALVLLNLEEHVQVERTKRCTCGWKPDYKLDRWQHPASFQHREHLAEEIAKSVKWERDGRD